MTLPGNLVPAEQPAEPVPVRDAVTVVLLRDGAEGLEAFLLRRVTGMAFAGGMTVFPGGGVDRRDADASVAWAGPDPAWWGQVFGVDEATARAFVCAAVRETFEESGVLLAGPDATSVVADTRPFAAARKALVDRELSLAQFLADANLVLRADLLRPWANWVTPVGEPRRYDTRFFVAALPEGQLADGETTEASHSAWQRPSDAIADAREGRHMLMPPTMRTLDEVGALGSVSAVMAEERSIDKIIPKLVRDGDVVRVVLQ
ncbi:NUDIX hydrolase [Lentzea sp. NBRC 105346]|uniref:NUDIX hydrolase n=1 Tax=Lentzea sp. NBRC 105346 TaxID=3032205 RepID=UPI0024A3751E|nr:NUDIX hydrolase [Lentzea sp. NBRC 105346]GLZ33000.1 NUDIX hydrolase [Lentzea sp. NBRC 105346]